MIVDKVRLGESIETDSKTKVDLNGANLPHKRAGG